MFRRRAWTVTFRDSHGFVMMRRNREAKPRTRLIEPVHLASLRGLQAMALREHASMLPRYQDKAAPEITHPRALELVASRNDHGP